MQAVLPVEMTRDKTFTSILAALRSGESAYVAPSALLLVPGGQYFMRVDVPTRSTLDAVFSMHVRRTPDGYVADISHCTHRWVPGTCPENGPYRPVERVVFADEFLS